MSIAENVAVQDPAQSLLSGRGRTVAGIGVTGTCGSALRRKPPAAVGDERRKKSHRQREQRRRDITGHQRDRRRADHDDHQSSGSERREAGANAQ